MSFSFPPNHLTLLAVIYVYYCIIILSNHLSVCIIINIIVLQYHSYDIIIFDKNNKCYTYLMGNIMHIMHYVIVWLARPNFSLSRGNERLRSSTPD